MKFLPIIGVLAFVALSCAVPLNHAEEESDVVTQQDLADVIETIDALEATATESQLYSWRRARDALKRAARRGVRVDVRANYAAQDANADLTSENIGQVIEALDEITEQDATATESQLYSLRRVKDAFRRAARRGVRVDVRANYAAQDADADLTSENIEQVIEALEKITEQDASSTTVTEDQLYSLRRVKDAFRRAARRGVRVDVRANYAHDKSTEDDDSSTNYFGRKLRRGLRKAGRVIEKGAKKALERGVNVNVPF